MRHQLGSSPDVPRHQENRSHHGSNHTPGADLAETDVRDTACIISCPPGITSAKEDSADPGPTLPCPEAPREAHDATGEPAGSSADTNHDHAAETGTQSVQSGQAELVQAGSGAPAAVLIPRRKWWRRPGPRHARPRASHRRRFLAVVLLLAVLIAVVCAVCAAASGTSSPGHAATQLLDVVAAKQIDMLPPRSESPVPLA